MKKNDFLIIMLIFFAIFILIAFYFFKKDEEDNFNFKENFVTLKVNQNIEIPIELTKLEKYKDINYSNYDNEIIEIIDNKFIKGKKIGATALLATLNNKTISLHVKVISNNNLNNNDVINESNSDDRDNRVVSGISMNNYEFPNVVLDKEQKDLKVLIVDIDPILNSGSINGKSCIGLTASSCLNQNKQQVINELIDDIEYSSHGIINVDIVKTEMLNEFSTHKDLVSLLNGTKSYRLDEATWLDIMKNGWINSFDDLRVKQMDNYTFDYEYLLNKLNLIERRNNNEFHEVWLLSVDPIKNFESIMVGKNSYMINGVPIIKDCDNFRIMNVSISRPDSNFECNGHAAEDILDNVFNAVVSYEYNSLSIDNSNYNTLNLWQKFTLTEHHNKYKNTGLSGVGDIHFSPNSIKAYDWENYSNKVTSKWKEWLNYPNLTNGPSNEVFSPNVYMNANISGTQSASRFHQRWWFSLIPHVTGYTKDGYSNNWWDYLYLSNFVTNVSVDKKNYTYKIGDYIDGIKFNLLFKNLENEIFEIYTYENNMFFSNKNIFNIDENGKIIAAKEGNSVLTYYRDGKSASVNIVIK